MFTKPSKNAKLDEAIDTLFEEMKTFTGDAHEYDRMTDQLKKLHELKNSKKTVSPDTLAVVGGNIAIALLIIGFEQKHVVATKLQSFLTKAR